MNKDSWTLIFNKANDITLLPLEDVKERYKQIRSEMNKRLQGKYVEFLDSLTPRVKTFFQKHFPDIDRLAYLLEDDVDYVEWRFIFAEKNTYSDNVHINIDTVDCQFDFYPMAGPEPCSLEDCQKIADFLFWLEANLV